LVIRYFQKNDPEMLGKSIRSQENALRKEQRKQHE
jgi:hypothetical protein